MPNALEPISRLTWWTTRAGRSLTDGTPMHRARSARVGLAPVAALLVALSLCPAPAIAQQIVRANPAPETATATREASVPEAQTTRAMARRADAASPDGPLRATEMAERAQTVSPGSCAIRTRRGAEPVIVPIACTR